MRKKLIVISVSLAIIIILNLFWLILQWRNFVQAPVIATKNFAPNKTYIEFTVKPGSSIHSVAKQLHQQGLLNKPEFFVWLAHWKKISSHLKAGEYRVDVNTTPEELLDKITSGKVIMRSFTIVEGRNFDQIMADLDKNHYVTHHLNGLDKLSIRLKLGLYQSPEGLFYPDTYLFASGVSDMGVLLAAHRRMELMLVKQWQKRSSGLPYDSPYQALVMASLIEKETSLDNERPLVAGVLIRRLVNKMRLQVDPTVIYGLGEAYNGKLTRADLRKESSYNTYLHHGLPPTPIAMPSSLSIYAALHPAGGNSLYYVAKGDGSHIFSESLAEHDIAIKNYLLKTNISIPSQMFNPFLCQGCQNGNKKINLSK